MAFQFPWTNLHELNLDWFLSKFKQFTNNFLETTATAESVPYTDAPSVTVTGGELDDDTDIVDPFTFNFKIPAGQPGAQGEQGVPGVPGAPGQDGFSPIATVTKSGTVATITITDANGTTTTTISDGEVTQAQLDTKASAIITSASGATAHFTDGADNIPVSGLAIGITPAQSGSGDPAPNNIRPISGWTGATISHSGADTSNPDTITISWQSDAGTVYGGTLDVTTGLLTVTHAMKLMTGASSEAWNLWDGKFVATINGIARSNSTSSNNKIIIADRFKSKGVQYRSGCGDGEIVKVVSSNDYIACYSSAYADINAFKASLGTNPMTVVYRLATTQTYQLTPQQLFNTLYGVNNVWSDTGDSTVTYTADTKLYIEQLTQPSEDDMIANTAIANGKFFMIGNNLYRATTAIASGSQIIPGTNATPMSLADALNLL